MKTLTQLTEQIRRFKPFARLRWAGSLRNGQRHKPGKRTRRHPAAESIAAFGGADLVRYGDGRWELHDSSPTDQAAALEWATRSPRQAAFPNQPKAVTAPRFEQPVAVHNRILIADDDNLVRGSLAAVLESEGFAVDEAQNGIEAVTRAIEHKPDLVLLDLNMPHWDGWTAFSQLDRVTPLVPVIVITARPNQYPKAVQLGVDAFMEKPLNIPILMHAIKRLTSEEEERHVRRITNRAFTTQWLGQPDL